MVNTIYLLSFVETPRKFIIAELSIRKLGSSYSPGWCYCHPDTYTPCSWQNVIIGSENSVKSYHCHIIVKSYHCRIISTDEDPSLRIESSAIINLRGVSTKLNKYNLHFVCTWLLFCHMMFLCIKSYKNTRMSSPNPLRWKRRIFLDRFKNLYLSCC